MFCAAGVSSSGSNAASRKDKNELSHDRVIRVCDGWTARHSKHPRCGARVRVMGTQRRILLIRLSALGDIVFASPLIRAFRQRFPGARISWLVAQPFADVLAAEHQLDELIVLPVSDWRSLVRARAFRRLARDVLAFRRSLAGRDFDMAVDLQGLLKSGIWAWLSGAKWRIGLGSREGSQWLMHQVVDRHGGDPERIASEYLYLAEELGLPASPFPMHVAVGGAARQRAAELLGPLGDGGFAVICPFTTRPQKHWPDGHWCELVPRLYDRFGMPVVMLGGPGDRERAGAISADRGLVDLVGRTDIQTAAAIIGRAGYVVGVDTGLTHMGMAFDRPTVCLFGSTRPYTNTATRQGRVLFHDLPCAPCRRNPTCDGSYDCMRELVPDEVLSAVAGARESRQ